MIGDNMKNKIVIISLITVMVIFFFVSLFRESYADENILGNITLELYDNVNSDILRDNIKYFIDLVDEDVILNSSYNFSSRLNENYDFLTNFAISFILNDEKNFDVIYVNNYLYLDKNGNEYVSNKYIGIDNIYDITNKIFGVDYYYITDKNLIIGNNMVVLISNNFLELDLLIDDIIKINVVGNLYDVYVKYLDNELIYVYRFEKMKDGRLYIKDLIIGE